MILAASEPYKFSASPVTYNISPVEKFGNVRPARSSICQRKQYLGSTITFDAAEGSVEEIAAVIGENKSSAIFFDSDVAFCMRMFRDRWGYLAFRRGG